jgi:hypothetical protein
MAAGRPRAAEADSELTATGEANQSQLASLFRRDPKAMPRLLQGLAPSGERRGAKIYVIADAAQRLVKPGYEVEQYLRRMHPSDMPPLMGKEFWNGQRARQAFEENEGDLWRTNEMVVVFAEACQTMRTSMLLFRDALEREESLSDEQTAALSGLIDGAIKDMQEALVERFANYVPPEYPSVSFESYVPLEEGDGEEQGDESEPFEPGPEAPGELDLDGL